MTFDEYIAKCIDEAPPISAERMAVVAAILGPVLYPEPAACEQPTVRRRRRAPARQAA